MKGKYIDDIERSSSPEPLGQFQLSFGQSILGWRNSSLLKWRVSPFFKLQKYIDEIKISSSQEPLSQFSLGTKPPWLKGIQVCTNEEPCLFPMKFKEPLDRFQPNFAPNILGWRGFKFIPTKALALFPGGNNWEIGRIHWQHFSKLLRNHWANFNQTLLKTPFDEKDSIFQRQGPFDSQKEIMLFFSSSQS